MEKDLITALIAASATLLGGVVTLVATQCIVKLIDPIFNLKKLIGEIAADLKDEEGQVKCSKMICFNYHQDIDTAKATVGGYSRL
jgi:hypothetical protein